MPVIQSGEGAGEGGDVMPEEIDIPDLPEGWGRIEENPALDRAMRIESLERAALLKAKEWCAARREATSDAGDWFEAQSRALQLEEELLDLLDALPAAASLTPEG